ncbi:MAG: hypothetical protein Q9221_003472 [Calogaya cf. arnoldii]
MTLFTSNHAARSLSILLALCSIAKTTPFHSPHGVLSHQPPLIAPAFPNPENTHTNTNLNPISTPSILQLSTSLFAPLPRALTTTPNSTYRLISIYLIQPTGRLLSDIGADINNTMYRFKSHIAVIDSYAPQTSFSLTLGQYRITFYSPVAIAWNIVTSIIETQAFILMMWYAAFGRFLYFYGTLAAIAVTVGIVNRLLPGEIQHGMDSLAALGRRNEYVTVGL